MFLKAIGCGGEVAPKGMLNLALLNKNLANNLAAGKFLHQWYLWPTSDSEVLCLTSKIFAVEKVANSVKPKPKP